MSAARTNKNENPLRQVGDLHGEVRWEDYAFKHQFTRQCTLAVDRDEEKLVIAEVHDDAGMQRRGIVYVLVVDGRIVKIGQSINTFGDRLGSYNTGKMSYRSRGTNSGANFFILQSLLNIGKPVEVYGFHLRQKTWHLFGESGTEAFPSAKIAEGIILKTFREQYGKRPIGNSQK